MSKETAMEKKRRPEWEGNVTSRFDVEKQRSKKDGGEGS